MTASTDASLNQANKWLVGSSADRFGENSEELALNFWRRVAEVMIDWKKLQIGAITSGELRKEMVHAHGVMIQAFGIMGARLITTRPNEWSEKLLSLQTINWRKTNTSLWEGRVMRQSRMDGSSRSIGLAANVLIKAVGLDLDDREKGLEDEFNHQLSETKREKIKI